MSERDDWTAATSGGGNMVQRRKKSRRWGRGQGNELSALLLEQLSLSEGGGNVTIEVPTGELKAEGSVATVKVTRQDGTEIDGRKVAQALQNIDDKLGKIRTSQTWNTKFAVISFFGGVILGNIDRASVLLAYFIGNTDPVTPYSGFFM